MLIFSVDPGFDRIGFALLKKTQGSHVLVHSECFQTDRALEFNDRLAAVVNRAESLIKKYKPKILAIERIYFGKNTKTALKIAEICGGIKSLACKYNVQIFEKSPNEIKLAITGNGAANKKQIEKMINRLIEIDTNKTMLDDEYDAIAIGLCCGMFNKTLQNL